MFQNSYQYPAFPNKFYKLFSNNYISTYMKSIKLYPKVIKKYNSYIYLIEEFLYQIIQYNNEIKYQSTEYLN